MKGQRYFFIRNQILQDPSIVIEVMTWSTSSWTSVFIPIVNNFHCNQTPSSLL